MREQYIDAIWCRSDSTWPWFMQLFWIVFLSCFLYPVLLSGLVLLSLSLSVSLRCFQVLAFPLTSYWPLWDLWRFHPYESGCCDYFSTRHRFPQGAEELCQQMWFTHSASPGPSSKAVRRLEGHQGGFEAMVLGSCPSPWGRGDPPSFPEARGCRRCRCRGTSAARSVGEWMALIAGPEVEPRVTKCFPSLFGNLGQPVREKKVRYCGKWEVICLGAGGVSILDLLNYVCFLRQESIQDTFSCGYRMNNLWLEISLNGFIWNSFTVSEISGFTNVLSSKQNAGDIKSVYSKKKYNVVSVNPKIPLSR